jgi:hypothetical protein
VDLALYARVVWRFRLIVAVGFLLALTLAILAMIRVGPSGVEYRQQELWASTTRLGVTQKGFPWGRLYAVEPTPEGAAAAGIPITDPNRFNSLAVLYAELATSDPVRRQMIESGGPIRGKIVAAPVVVGENRVQLPLIDLTAIATSRRGAVTLAQRSAHALSTYVQRQQLANGVPSNDRAVIQQVVRPKPPEVYQPRSKTMPLVVFFAVMFATVGLVFLLENLRPRVREFREPVEAEFHGTPRRRTA